MEAKSLDFTAVPLERQEANANICTERDVDIKDIIAGAVLLSSLDGALNDGPDKVLREGERLEALCLELESFTTHGATASRK